MLAATAQAAEIAEHNWKLRLSDEELDHINKWFNETQGMRHFSISKIICVLVILKWLGIL